MLTKVSAVSGTIYWNYKLVTVTLFFNVILVYISKWCILFPQVKLLYKDCNLRCLCQFQASRVINFFFVYHVPVYKYSSGQILQDFVTLYNMEICNRQVTDDNYYNYYIISIMLLYMEMVSDCMPKMCGVFAFLACITIVC